MTTEKNMNGNLQSISVDLPDMDYAIDVKYYDSSPNDINLPVHKRKPIVLTSHGTPGSHNDFKYMVPQLIAFGYRVIGVNWPGFGITENPPEELFDHSNSSRAHLLTNFVKSLQLKRIDVAIGHSAGCYPYPLFFNDNPNVCSAAVFIAPGGATPHVSWRPYWFTKLIGYLTYTWLSPLATYYAYFVMTRVCGLRLNEVWQAALIARIASSIDFENLNANIELLKERKNPAAILVCGGKDHLVEKEKSIEYAEKLDCQEHDGIYVVEKSEQIENVALKISRNGRLDRHYAVLFEQGNHFLQKHEAESICKLINVVIEASSD